MLPYSYKYLYICSAALTCVYFATKWVKKTNKFEANQNPETAEMLFFLGIL